MGLGGGPRGGGVQVLQEAEQADRDGVHGLHVPHERGAGVRGAEEEAVPAPLEADAAPRGSTSTTMASATSEFKAWNGVTIYGFSVGEASGLCGGMGHGRVGGGGGGDRNN
jgi:hypothetical protein